MRRVALVLAAVVAFGTTAQAAGAHPRARPGRDIAAYRGLGTWVDAYDFSPTVAARRGRRPVVTPLSVNRMAARGIRTLYLQAAMESRRTPGALLDPGVLRQFLVRAHSRGIRVVAWYVPEFASLKADLRHLSAMRALRYRGHRFDGIAVDIEWRTSVRNIAVRNARLLALSRRLRAAMGPRAVGAVVMPPIQLDAVNRAFWPAFPWRALAQYYDVWLPMGYWTDRTRRSGWRDATRYTVANVKFLRAHLGRPSAPVHAIGGIGSRTTTREYTNFARAARRLGAIGVSVYDYPTTPAAAWPRLRRIS